MRAYQRRVDVHRCEPPGVELVENRALLGRHPVQVAQPFEMLLGDAGEHGHVGVDEFRQGRHLARVLVPISTTRYSSAASADNSVSGTPISLLKLFGAQRPRIRPARTWSIIAFVVVLPLLPTTAMRLAEIRPR